MASAASAEVPPAAPAAPPAISDTEVPGGHDWTGATVLVDPDTFGEEYAVENHGADWKEKQVKLRGEVKRPNRTTKKFTEKTNWVVQFASDCSEYTWKLDFIASHLEPSNSSCPHWVAAVAWKASKAKKKAKPKKRKKASSTSAPEPIEGKSDGSNANETHPAKKSTRKKKKTVQRTTSTAALGIIRGHDPDTDEQSEDEYSVSESEDSSSDGSDDDDDEYPEITAAVGKIDIHGRLSTDCATETKSSGGKEAKWTSKEVEYVKLETCGDKRRGPDPRLKEEWKERYGYLTQGELAAFIHADAVRATFVATLACMKRKNHENTFTMADLYVHIGIKIGMTLVKLPREVDYWSTAPGRGGMRFTNFTKHMTLRRFKEIASYLTFALPEEHDEDDRCWKTRNVYNLYRGSIIMFHDGKCYKIQAIDEAMLAAGMKRAPAVRVMPNKPITRGWKFFVLGQKCDHLGRSMNTIIDLFWDDGIQLSKEMVKDDPCNFGGGVVKKLCGPLKNKGWHVFVDRFFPNVHTCKWVLEQGGHITGTWDTRFGYPGKILKLLSKKPTIKCPKGTHTHATAHGGLINGWTFMDNSGCSMIDTAFGSKATELPRMEKRGANAGSIVGVTGPVCNVAYQTGMTVIDVQDQTRCKKKGFGCIALSRRRMKWTVKFFENLIDFANTQAHLVFKYIHEGEADCPSDYVESQWRVHEHFLNAPEWLTNPRARTARQPAKTGENKHAMSGRSSPPTRPGEIMVLDDVHLQPGGEDFAWHRRVSKVCREIDEKKKRNFVPRDCAGCKLAKRGNCRTVFGCADCTPYVHLHPQCFEEYHTKVASGEWAACRGRPRGLTYTDKGKGRGRNSAQTQG